MGFCCRLRCAVMREDLEKLLRGEVLRPELRVNRQIIQNLWIDDRLRERSAKRLAARGEDLLDEASKRAGVVAEAVVPAHSHQRRFDLRRRPECLRRKRAEKLDLC